MNDVESGSDHAVVAGALRRFAVMVAGAAALMVWVHMSPAGERLRDWSALHSLMAVGGVQGGLTFLLLTTVLVAMGTPRLVFYAFGGIAFGFRDGLLLSLCGSVLGSYLVFRLVRWGGRDWLARRFGAVRLVRRIVATRPTVPAIALLRMLPVSNLVVSVGLALGVVGNRSFLLGTAAGFLPQGILVVLIGSGVTEAVALQDALPLVIALSVAMALVCWLLQRCYARRRPSGTTHPVTGRDATASE